MKIDDEGPRGLFPSAFEPDDEGVSVTWLEFFPEPYAHQLNEVRAAISKRRKIRKSNGLAVLDVGKIVSVGKSLSAELQVVHDPDLELGKENPAHSLILGIHPGHDDLKGQLAVVALTRIEPGVPDS
jgi:hypothetical protein